MPHFLTPGVGETLGPPDPVLERWRERIAQWRSEVARTGDPDAVTRAAAAAGITPMPVLDQMKLQWELVLAGLEVTRSRSA